MKKAFSIVFLSFILLAGFSPVFSSDKTDIYFFYGKTCPHCAQEKAFLEDLAEKYPQIELKELPVSENSGLLGEYYENYRVPERVYGWVPITFIEDRYFLGFSEEIGERIEKCFSQERPCDPQEEPDNSLEEISTPLKEGKEVSLPLIGKINLENYSLPALAVILGFFDGFNFCSLGALVLILSLVLALRERRKVFAFGSMFILTTALVYGLLIVLWYKVFSFFAPYLRAMEVAIGILGVLGGVYFLRQFLRYKKYGPTCQTENGAGLVSRLLGKIKGLLEEKKSLFLALLGILAFAAVVTIVEFPCSAAIPVIFAGILAKAGLGSLEHFLYIGLFVLFYMLDELAVFLIAALTMSIKLISPRILICITLLASLVLFFLGFYYLFGF